VNKIVVSARSIRDSLKEGTMLRHFLFDMRQSSGLRLLYRRAPSGGVGAGGCSAVGSSRTLGLLVAGAARNKS
jgi:hypothetical protein